jgi:hypothetical protein
MIKGLNPVAVGAWRTEEKLSINVNGQWCSAVEELTRDPKFKGSNPAQKVLYHWYTEIHCQCHSTVVE